MYIYDVVGELWLRALLDNDVSGLRDALCSFILNDLLTNGIRFVFRVLSTIHKPYYYCSDWTRQTFENFSVYMYDEGLNIFTISLDLI